MSTQLDVVREQLDEAIAAAKCHGCGCFRDTVAALGQTEPGARELGAVLAQARAAFVPQKYDCLGCEACFPALAANAFAEAFPELSGALASCPGALPATSAGWPPLPGDYTVLRHDAPVAVCTLSSAELASALAKAAPDALAIVGTLHTENLGIERLILNVVSNPNLRHLVLAGMDSRQAVGHLPGQSLSSLIEHGVDAGGRIVGAKGKRPVLQNLGRDVIEAFRSQVGLVSLIGETRVQRIFAEVERCGCVALEPRAAGALSVEVARVRAAETRELVADPAGYFVLYPDRRARRLSLEHYTNAGVLTCVLEGEAPSALWAEAIARGLVSRLDHAAYLGRELTRAEQALQAGVPYVQDRAPGAAACDAPGCGCAGRRDAGIDDGP